MPGHVELLSSLILGLLLLPDPLTTHVQSLFSQAVAFNGNKAYYLNFMPPFCFESVHAGLPLPWLRSIVVTRYSVLR